MCACVHEQVCVCAYTHICIYIYIYVCICSLPCIDVNLSDSTGDVWGLGCVLYEVVNGHRVAILSRVSVSSQSPIKA